MPDEPVDLAELERLRAELYQQLSEVGDFRRGSLHAVMRKCGKPNCACAAPDRPGHGPQYNFTKSVAGKTVNVHLKHGPLLDKIEREVAAYERFRALVGEVTETSEAICEVRPISAVADQAPPASEGAEKRGSSRRSRRPSPRR
jgi:hypothetical protein